ncbi:MAG: N-acetylmuramoyl-L-alanine amidase [Elusimicrobia bacterium]|nr:N-acetylmuramoyl-L-alanine amidase [Elusimicrobiota bacterium]
MGRRKRENHPSSAERSSPQAWKRFSQIRKIKNLLRGLGWAGLFWAAPAFAQGPFIQVSYPPQGSTVPFKPATFILGSVTLSSAVPAAPLPPESPKPVLTVNGQPVKVYKTGGFLHYLPVSPGEFNLRLSASLEGRTTDAAHTLYVERPLPSPSTGAFEIVAGSVFPASDQSLAAGDWLEVGLSATPGLKGEFAIEGLRRRLPLAETPGQSGLYRGLYRIRPGDEAQGARIEFKLKRGFWSSLKARAPGRLSAGAAPYVVETATETVVLKTGPGEGYMLFPQKGTRFIVDGAVGQELRAFLSGAESGWLQKNDVRRLEGAAPPQAVPYSVKTAAGPGATTVSIGLSEQVPFAIYPAENGGGLTLQLYYTASHINWIVYDPKDSLVEKITWRQAQTLVTRIDIALNPGQAWWGYGAAYESGQLNIRIRRAPALAGVEPVLKGRSIVLDPGHASGNGAVSPLGYFEKDVNFLIARPLKEMLEKAGARVALTRGATEEVSLTARPDIARTGGGELFVSIHNNALPDGTNPFAEPRGFSVYYYHPHSMALAGAVHKAFQKNIPLPDEGLRYGNLYVARMPEMPAILVECAYMIFPEQEEKLLQADFQKNLAASIYEGIEKFLESERKKQTVLKPEAVP